MTDIYVQGDVNKREEKVGLLGMGAYFFYENNLYIKLNNNRKNNACLLTGEWSGTVEAIPRDAIATTYDRIMVRIYKHETVVGCGEV